MRVRKDACHRGVTTHLSDRHGAQNVQEDEGAVCGVVSQQVPMRQPLDVRERREGQLCHHSTVKSGKENKRIAIFGKLISFLLSEDFGTEIEL